MQRLVPVVVAVEIVVVVVVVIVVVVVVVVIINLAPPSTGLQTLQPRGGHHVGEGCQGVGPEDLG